MVSSPSTFTITVKSLIHSVLNWQSAVGPSTGDHALQYYSHYHYGSCPIDYWPCEHFIFICVSLRAISAPITDHGPVMLLANATIATSH